MDTIRLHVRYLRIIGILIGLSLLGYLFHQVGASRLAQSLALLGWGYALVLVSPLSWDLINTVGFRKAFPARLRRISFLKLAEIRIVGETFNALLPSGYVGGEPLKVKFLSTEMQPHEATSSVLVAKVAQSASLVLYLILGLTVTVSGHVSPLRQHAILGGVGLLALGIAIFGVLIARGSFSAAAQWLTRWTRHPWLAHQAPRLEALDQSLRAFFRHEKRRFLASLFWHGIGWFVSAMEVTLIFYLLGRPISWQAGWFMAAMAQLSSTLALAVPAGIGFYEGGHYLAAGLLGLPPSLGLSVGLIRRVRELCWHGLGLLLFWHLSRVSASARSAERRASPDRPSSRSAERPLESVSPR